MHCLKHDLIEIIDIPISGFDLIDCCMANYLNIVK